MGRKEFGTKVAYIRYQTPHSIAAQCWSTEARFVVDRTRYFADPSARVVKGLG